MKYYVNAYDSTPILIAEVAEYEGNYIYAYKFYQHVKAVSLNAPRDYWIPCTPENFREKWGNNRASVKRTS